MNKKMLKLNRTTLTIVMALFTAMLFASFLQQTTATPTIANISPNSGPVGTTVRVTGAIDTVNGSYQILWDGENVKEGTCVNTTSVNDTFTTPISATGNHNVTLYDVNASAQSTPALFIVTTSYYVFANPPRIQEGINTSITVGVNGAEANTTYTVTVNVTSPQPTFQSYNTTLTVSTNIAGSGSNSTLYPGDFTSGANADYVGTYTVIASADNQTLATGSFTVGLTDKLEYQRQEKVTIRGSGFDANETVTVNITLAGTPTAGYPKNVAASIYGLVSDLWEIPLEAPVGTYTIYVTNATTPGTLKTPSDAQNFTVVATTLAVTVTDQPQTQYERTETALVKFNITYPSRALYNATHLGTMTISVYYNTTSVANVSLTVANYEPATGKWSVTWRIPKDAVLGTGYNFKLLKDTIADAFGNRGPSTNIFSTTFTVSKAFFTTQIKTVNRANEASPDVSIEVYKTTANQSISTQKTNTTGWATFQLELGNYTFKAFWKNVEVGVLLNQSIEKNETLVLECWLANVEVTVKDDAKKPLSLVDITLMCNYTTRNKENITETKSVQTDRTGTVRLFNLLANISYRIEARRYNFLFNSTIIESLTQPWNNITLIAPTYTTFVLVMDSKNASVGQGVQIAAYEWMSGTGEPTQSNTTNAEGKVSLALTFGKYKLRVFKDSTLLNETAIDVVENQLSFIINCRIYNVDLTVVVTDYFGQPIPNALVKLERQVDSGDVKEAQTGPNGVASFTNLVGGDSSVSVFMAGRMVGLQSVYIADSKQVAFRINGYVTFAGHPLETSQLATLTILITIVVVSILALTYKRIWRVFTKRKKS